METLFYLDHPTLFCAPGFWHLNFNTKLCSLTAQESLRVHVVHLPGLHPAAHTEPPQPGSLDAHDARMSYQPGTHLSLSHGTSWQDWEHCPAQGPRGKIKCRNPLNICYWLTRERKDNSSNAIRWMDISRLDPVSIPRQQAEMHWADTTKRNIMGRERPITGYRGTARFWMHS